MKYKGLSVSTEIAWSAVAITTIHE